MSYWASISVPTGPDSQVECWSENYTSNMSFLWSAALALPDRPRVDAAGDPVMCRRLDKVTGAWQTVQVVDWGLRLLDGAPCSEAAGVLADAAVRVRTPELRRDGLERQPAHGWGDYDSAAQFLERLAAAAAAHSFGVIRVSS